MPAVPRHGLLVGVDDEGDLCEVALRRGRRLHLHLGLCACAFDVLAERCGAIGAVAVDLDRRVARCLFSRVESFFEHRHGRRCVSDIARGDFGCDDELGVWVNGYVPLVAVESRRRGLASVTRVGIDRGDDAVLCDASRDGKDVVVALDEVLTEDGRKQAPRRRVRVRRAGARGGSASAAKPSCASASTRVSRAFASSQSQAGFPGFLWPSSRQKVSRIPLARSPPHSPRTT